jgi:hypothetical protein
MAERMTDAFNRLFSSLVNSIVNYTKAGYLVYPSP